MGFWTALRLLFALCFTFPELSSFGNLCTPKWRDLFTIKNVSFGFFWGLAFSIATKCGLWPRLWEHVLLDVELFYGWGSWTWLYKYSILVQFAVFTVFLGVLLVMLYLLYPAHFRKTMNGAVEFLKQLSMHVYTFQTRDNDGDIMVIRGAVENKSENKRNKSKFGVPKSIRIKQQQAMESAKASVDESIGSIGKAFKPMKKK